MTTPDPATRTRISATHSSSWRGLRIGIICLRSGVICPILGARGKRSLFKSPSSHHAQRDRSRNWSIKTAICVVSLRVFSCRRARVMSLMKHSSRVCHRGDWMGTCARRGLRSRSDIVPKSLLRHDYVRNGSKCTALTRFQKHQVANADATREKRASPSLWYLHAPFRVGSPSRCWCSRGINHNIIAPHYI